MSEKTIKFKWKFMLVQSIYIIVITFAFFLMFLGVLRTFEINDPSYESVQLWCEPRGFFGWGYDCDNNAYLIAVGYLPNDYEQFPEYDFNYSFNIS